MCLRGRQFLASSIVRRVGFIFTLVLIMSGCAATREIIDVRIPTTPNPSGSTPIKIARVTDQRKFAVDSQKYSTPSIKGGEIHNKALTSRAMHRKVNLRGKPMGDILLPEDRTVELLVSEAVELAFQQAGFPVLKSGDPGYDSAVLVNVDIDQFWAWHTFSKEFDLAFEVRLRITGEIVPFQDGEIVRGQSKFPQMYANEEEFLVPVNRGLKELINNIRNLLVEAR